MRDVAALAGVSAKTVSRVMHNDRYVSSDVRRRVEQAIGELRYVPNTLARTFRSGRDAAIGIAVPDISDPFFATITEAAVRIARARHTAVLVTSLGNDPAGEQPAVEALLARQVAGLIATPICADQSYLKPWQSRIAVVFIDRAPARITADSVVEDDYAGAHQAVTHLIGHGHRRIAFAGDAGSITTTARRLEGYRAALGEAGLTASPDLIAMGAGSRASAEMIIGRLLGLSDPATAVFSSNAMCSIAVFPVLKGMGRTDVAFISFGDFPLADSLEPALSVVDQDPASVGQMAATRLFERMDHPGRRLKRRIVLPLHVVARASCCSMPAAARPASAALGIG